MKEQTLQLRNALKSSRHYLLDEIWPKHNVNGVTIENPDRKVILQVMKDERFMTALGLNP